MLLQRGNKNLYTVTSSSFDLALFQCILGTQSAPQMTECDNQGAGWSMVYRELTGKLLMAQCWHVHARNMVFFQFLTLAR